MRKPTPTIRFLLTSVVLLAATGCSRGFWDRTPRVGGRYQPAPYAPSSAAQAPSRSAPTVRAAPPTQAPAQRAPEQLRAMPSNVAPRGGSCTPTTEEQQVLQEVNAIRTSQGLRPYVWAPLLYRAAQDHSREQEQHGYMGHGSPDPSRRTLVQRMQLAGYPGVMYGEVVAWGYRGARSVVEGWMNSSEHRAILIDRDLTEAGFARIGQYWTGNFGAPRAAPARSYPSASSAPYAGARAPQASRPSYTTPPSYRSPQAPNAAPSYATPTPRSTPRPAPRVQDYFRQPLVQPHRAPVYQPPTRGG